MSHGDRRARKARKTRETLGPIPGSDIFLYRYTSDTPGKKIGFSRVDTAPHTVCKSQSHCTIADGLGRVDQATHGEDWVLPQVQTFFDISKASTPSGRKSISPGQQRPARRVNLNPTDRSLIG